jgi:hypothetical protein
LRYVSLGSTGAALGLDVGSAVGSGAGCALGNGLRGGAVGGFGSAFFASAVEPAVPLGVAGALSAVVGASGPGVSVAAAPWGSAASAVGSADAVASRRGVSPACTLAP